ncbi:peroxidase [Rhexocercosporidium sp. MPI-PUGE-AT-0058]|nr:peroxidase [Rhexocercosporidium sp. MPI-PUGE-AT-0058]
MKFTSLILGATVVAYTAACPGTDQAMKDLNTKLRAREAPGPNDSDEMIGDLATIGGVTTVGKTVQDILLGNVDPYSDEKWVSWLPAKGSAQCAKDTCCIWKWIAQDMEAKFRGGSGRCNRFARAAIRLGFHDAGAWSKTTGFGGADGSLILAGEINRPENNGLQEIVGVTQDWYNKYKKYDVGMADLIQMGANVATVVCPLGPRVRSFVGRKDSSTPAADNLLPSVFADADSLIELFENKTIKAHGLAALVGAHTTSQQHFVDPKRALDPQDSTPGVWDVKFYSQTIGSAPKRVFKFPSDVVLAAHPKISDEWAEFAGVGGQEHWDEDYAKEYVRLSLLGVNNINDLAECTRVLPAAKKAFNIPDSTLVHQWLDGKYSNLGQAIEDGQTLTDALVRFLGLFTGRLFGRDDN